MKSSAIKQIFQDASNSMKLTEEERELLSVVSDTYDELLKELTPRQKQLHDKFIDAREDSFCEEMENIYKEGFKFGLRLGIECMDD